MGRREQRRRLKTVNGGSSWTSSTPTTSNLNAVHFVSATLGWAVGDQGSVIRTSNGGTNWSEQRPVTANLKSVYFIDDHFGWAVGTSGAAVETIDGGDVWAVSSPAAVTLNGVFFASVSNRVSVTVMTSPPGRAFSVDGVDYSSAQSFLWDAGAPHTLATPSPQNGATGTRYVWSTWSNGGAISQSVSPTENATYTATFTTQHQLTMQSGANGTVDPVSGWFNAGDGVSITATPDASYGFNGWTGSGSGSYTGWANPALITINGPITETAAFGTDVTVIVQCTPTGASFSVDGTLYATTQQFTWAPGSSHTVDAASPQDVSADTRYVFTRWSDNGGASHSVAPVSNTTLSATFKTQYTLTTTAGTGGTVTTANGWNDAGAIVSLVALPDSGYSFQKWTGTGMGSYTGSSNPKSISINGPIVEDAAFVLGTTPAAPSSLVLLSNAPNPFRTQTDIRFGLPGDSDVRIDIFDVTGRRVFSDVMAGASSGWQSYRFDSTHTPVPLSSGVYFVRVSTHRSTQTGRMVILR